MEKKILKQKSWYKEFVKDFLNVEKSNFNGGKKEKWRKLQSSRRNKNQFL